MLFQVVLLSRAEQRVRMEAIVQKVHSNDVAAIERLEAVWPKFTGPHNPTRFAFCIDVSLNCCCRPRSVRTHSNPLVR